MSYADIGVAMFKNQGKTKMLINNKIKIGPAAAAVIAAALPLAACSGGSADIYTESTTVVTESRSEYTSEAVTTSADVTSSGRADNFGTETGNSSAETVIISSHEDMTEFYYSEIASAESESIDVTVSSDLTTDMLLESTAAVPSFESSAEGITTLSLQDVTPPEIRTGCFDGSSVIENELACADISDLEHGVIGITYYGVCDKVKVRIACGTEKYDYDYVNGAGINVYPLQMGDGEYVVTILENVTGKSYATALSGSFKVELYDEFQPYLMPTQFIMYDSDSECVYKAAQLTFGCTGDIEKIAAIFGYVTENVVYDKELAASVAGGYIPSPDSTLSSGKGICFDYASLFAAMCRSQNIPSRLVMGYVNGSIYHSWNEVYTDETGWITVDLFLSEKGYNMVDPTFYASAENKEEIAEFIGSGEGYTAILRY